MNLKWMCCLLLASLLSGCAAENRELARAMEFREKLLAAQGCTFQVEVTADYGDSLQSFSMDCRGDEQGTVAFTLTAPERIGGIQGEIDNGGGNILYDGEALSFPLLTDDLLTPASAPWIFLKTLRSGYLTSACQEEDRLHLCIDDSYEEDALFLDIWLNEEDQPERADILHDGHRILSLEVENFVFS